MSNEIYNEIRNPSKWRKVQKKQYEAYFCIARSGLKITDKTTLKQYETTKESRVVYSGVIGELRITDIRFIMSNFSMYDGSDITMQSLSRNARIDKETGENVTDWIHIKSNTRNKKEWAFHIPPKYKNFIVADNIVANNSKLSSCGDFIIAQDNGGEPNLSDVRLVRGSIFVNMYDMRTFPNVAYSAAVTNQPEQLTETTSVADAARSVFNNETAIKIAEIFSRECSNKILEALNGKIKDIRFECKKLADSQSQFGMVHSYMLFGLKYNIYAEFKFIEKHGINYDNLEVSGVFMCGGSGNVIVKKDLDGQRIKIGLIAEKVADIIAAMLSSNSNEDNNIQSVLREEYGSYMIELKNIIDRLNKNKIKLSALPEAGKNEYKLDVMSNGECFGSIFVSNIDVKSPVGIVDVRYRNSSGKDTKASCVCNEKLARFIDVIADSYIAYK